MIDNLIRAFKIFPQHFKEQMKNYIHTFIYKCNVNIFEENIIFELNNLKLLKISKKGHLMNCSEISFENIIFCSSFYYLLNYPLMLVLL